MNNQPGPILKVDTAFARQVVSEWKVDLFACYQCGKCSNGCPVTFAMDYPPHQLIRMLQLGLVDEVLGSRTIWVCASCETCTTRCPNGIEISGLMDDLKHQVLEAGREPAEEDVAGFHRTFLDNINTFGRVNETFLMGAYQIRSAWTNLKRSQFDLTDLVRNMRLGMNMLKRGRLSLLPRSRGRKAVRRIFREG